VIYCVPFSFRVYVCRRGDADSWEMQIRRANLNGIFATETTVDTNTRRETIVEVPQVPP
jgi:hypothetical protein